MKWYLDDVREMDAAAPYTFYIPSEEVLRQLKVGDLLTLPRLKPQAHPSG
ncbi:hypothetical protein [Exiguobacterium alkaliphilum]